MARPTKKGLEYFPLDTDIDQDEKIIVVVAKFGMLGFGILIRLMMEIYRNGYYYPWSEREQLVLSMKLREPVEIVVEVVNECLKWGFFHKEMFEQQGILTSKGFQKRYLLAAGRRKGTEIAEEHKLIEEVFTTEKIVSADINPDKNDIMPTESTPKKSKEKKPKEKTVPLEFDKFWSLYPKKASKQDAIKAWAALIKSGASIDDILEATKKYAQECQGKEIQFIKHAATFLRNDRWKDHLMQTTQGVYKSTVTLDKETALQQWIQRGNNPDEFEWE